MRRILDLPPAKDPVQLGLIKGSKLVSTCVGSNGEAIRMFVPEEAADAVFARWHQPGFASFPKTHTEEKYSANISVSLSEQTLTLDLPLVSATFPNVQTLPGGDILVVAPRCKLNRDGTYDLNAKVYHRDGSIAGEFCLGDGIEHVQTDNTGNIWVGYFDEGIFGNFGWGGTEATQPIGSSGLVRFDRSGKRIWEYCPPDGLDSIWDCYALNVTSDTAWASYYANSPLIRVNRNGTIE